MLRFALAKKDSGHNLRIQRKERKKNLITEITFL